MNEVIDVLNNDGLVLIPTDTVYGISGIATSIDAIKKVYELKKRDNSKPLIVLVSSYEMLLNYVDSVSTLDKKLIDKYWPGALTLIFKSSKLPKEVMGGKDTIGIRCPNNKFLLELIDSIGKPIFSTSANLSGCDVVTKVSDLSYDILDNIDYVVDDGEINGVSSTIVSTLDGNINVLRDGELAEDIKRS